ncbi:MAG: hypothetical protein K1V75_06920 [Muribaculaceae bacterium]
MKKFYAFAAAAMVAVSANAQALYMTGASAAAEEGGLPAQWDPANPAEFEVVDGNFQLEVAGLSTFKISTVKGTYDETTGAAIWDEYNANALGCEYGNEQGVAVALEAGNDANIMCPWTGDWKVVVAGDLSTITLTTNTPAPDGIKLYLRGDMNSWDNIEGWEFEQLSDNVFRFVFGEGQAIAAGETFKIADGGWAKYNFGAGEDAMLLLEVDTEIFNGSNTNMTLEEECNGVCWFTFDGNWVAFSNDPDFVPEFAGNVGVNSVAASNGEAQYFNLQGVRVANPENGIFIVVKDGKSYKTVVK